MIKNNGTALCAITVAKSILKYPNIDNEEMV